MQVSFGCTLVLGPASLELSYVVTNHERQDIGIFNWIRATRADGTLDFQAEAPYVELTDDTLLVRKMALPVPPGLQVTAYVPPPASRIGANKSFSERLVLPIPVKVMQPLRAALVGLKAAGQVVADSPAKAQKLRLEVGVFPIDDQCRLEAENPAHPKVLTALPPGPAIARQQVLSFDKALGKPVDVLDYKAYPW